MNTSKPIASATSCQKSSSPALNAEKCAESRVVEPPADDDAFDDDRADGVGTLGAAVLVVRGCVGASFLLMPHIMKTLGYVPGTLLILVTGFVYFRTVHTLLAVERRLRLQLRVAAFSYVELVDAIFARTPIKAARRLRVCVRTLMYAFYALPTSNAVYLVLMADGTRKLLANYAGVRCPATYLISAQIVPLALVCMSSKILRILVPYSYVTNAFTLAMAAILLAYSTAQRRPSSAATRPFGDPYSAPECVAKCVKAYCCTGLILPLRNGMRRPRTLTARTGALNAAAAAVVAFYYAFGAVLYANYGDAVRENVLFNLPADSRLGDCIGALYTLTLYVAYVLAFYSRFDNVWSGTLKRTVDGTSYGTAVDYAARVAINALAYAMAVVVPNLAVISAFAGTLSMVVEVALPSVLELMVAFERRTTDKRYLTAAKCCCLIGVCVALFGTSLNACVKQVVAMYRSPR